MSITFSSLPINGYQNQAIPNTFLRQEGETDHLAIQFPGWGYSADMPVLYYPGLVMLAQRADLLKVEYGYNKRPDFAALDPTRREAWLRADAQAALAAGLEQRAYRRITLMGKSIGTRVLGTLLDDPRLAKARLIWLTPLLNDEQLVERIRTSRQCGLFVIGEQDSYYHAERLASLAGRPCCRSLVIPAADHSLEIEGDLEASLRAMENLVAAVEAFVR